MLTDVNVSNGIILSSVFCLEQLLINLKNILNYCLTFKSGLAIHEQNVFSSDRKLKFFHKTLHFLKSMTQIPRILYFFN